MRIAAIAPLCKRLAESALVFCVLSSFSARGQTQGQLEARFKKVLAFEIRPGIDAYPTFAPTGGVCQIVIEKRQYLEPGNSDFDVVIPSTLARQLVDEVVPASERGKPARYLNPDSFIAGGASYIQQDYENVSVGMYGSDGVRVIVIKWPKRSCSLASR